MPYNQKDTDALYSSSRQQRTDTTRSSGLGERGSRTHATPDLSAVLAASQQWHSNIRDTKTELWHQETVGSFESSILGESSRMFTFKISKRGAPTTTTAPKLVSLHGGRLQSDRFHAQPTTSQLCSRDCTRH